MGFQQELLIGGWQPRTISGTSATALTNCDIIVPDANGCVIASLKRSDNTSINWADSSHLNLAGNDIGGHGAPITCMPDMHWVEITLTSGMCQACRIGVR